MSTMSDATDLILSASDAAHLVRLKERGHLVQRITLSVKGTVTALSAQFRVKKEWTFLIQLDHSIILIVKDFHHDWYSQLKPTASYIFRDLRLTVMERGSLKQHVIFLVWPTSSYTTLEDESAIRCTPLEKWLEKSNISGLSLQCVEHGVSSCDKDDDDQLINYEGVVTSTDEASAGVYVLDDKIRLHVQAICTPDILQTLKNQCRVSVYNAHITEVCKQAALVCCSRSCIRTIDSGEDVEDNDDLKYEAMGLNKITGKYGLNTKEILTVIEMKKALAGQSRSKRDVLRMISIILTSHLCHDMMKCHANSIDHFILHGNLCPFINSKKERCRIPTVLHISTLKTEAIQEGSLVMKGKHSVHNMSYGLEENKVLIGQIRILDSGITEFQDETGCVPVLLLSSRGKKPLQCRGCDSFSLDRGSCERRKGEQLENPEDHTCCHCCLSQVGPGELVKCDIPHPVMTGKKVCVRKFNFIVESCEDTDLPYLAISLQDCLSLEHMKRKDVVSSPSLDGAAISSQVSDKSDEEKSFFVYIEEKHPLIQFPNYHFQILGLKLTPGDLVCEEVDCQLGKSRNKQTCDTTPDDKAGQTPSSPFSPDLENVCDNDSGSKRREVKSDTSPAKRARFQNLFDNNMCNKRLSKGDNPQQEQVVVKDNPVNVKESNNKTETLSQDAPGKGHSSKSFKPFSVSFCDSACRWYSFIVPGSVYKLSLSKKQEDLNPLKPVFTNARFERAAKNFNVRLGIEVPDDVSVERVIKNLCPHLALPNSPSLLPIQDVLLESFTESFVSFKGVIVSREDLNQFSFPSTSSFSRKDVRTFTMTDTKLEVAELLSSDCNNPRNLARISVYLAAPVAFYSIGLIPGAVVTFHRLERKVSKTGNIYCKFITGSNSEVASLGSSTDYAACRSSISTSICDLPKTFLINIWQRGADGKVEGSGSSLSWQIHCHVIMIYFLRLKWSCSVCKGTFSKDGCLAKSCRNSTASTQEAQAKLLVEDGTCQASMMVRDKVLVQRLLTLTDRQWEELMSAVLDTGEIYVSKLSGPLSTFLNVLTKSVVVLRPCKMAVKVSRGSPSSLSVDKFSIDKFDEKEVRLGKIHLKTRMLPLLSLECFGLEDID